MKTKISTIFLLTLTFALFTTTAAAAGTFFTVEMSGSHMVPPNSSTATAFLAFELEEGEGSSRGRIQTTGIPSSGTTINMQCPSGSDDVPMTSSFFYQGFGSLDGPKINAMKNGNCFFKINTAAFPGGEIGGYAKVATPFLATMNMEQYAGTQPFNDANRRGSVGLILNSTQTKAFVIFRFNSMLLSPSLPTIAIYAGNPGENGVLVNTISFSDIPTGALDPVAGFSMFDISAANLAKLKSGQLYFQVSETSGPQAKIRGQIHRRKSTVLDYDGDAKTDFAVVRQNTDANVLNWYAKRSSDGGFSVFSTANASHYEGMNIIAGDFDGDGKDDISYWFNNNFYILQSGNSTLRVENFGLEGDKPTIADDYDGDGKADVAVYRKAANPTDQSYFYYRGSANNPSGNITVVPWGLGSDYGSTGDYDGDAKADFVIQRPTMSGVSQVWILKSGGGTIAYTFGLNTDYLVPGDYDGDGKTDVCIFRTTSENKEWYVLRSLNTTYYAAPFGAPEALNAQGDYDGDGKTDFAVWQNTAPTPSNSFWILNSSNQTVSNTPWGLTTDSSVNSFNIH